MKPRFLTIICILSLALAALSACTDAIYATIQTERKTITDTLSTTISIFDIAIVPPLSPIATYYVAAGRVFQGQFANSYITWDPLSDKSDTPYNPPSAFCNCMVYYPNNDSLYGGFISKSDQFSLIKSKPSIAGSPYYSFNGGTTITDPVLAGKQIVSLGVVTPYLFAGATLDTSTYEIDYSLTGALGSFSSLLSGSAYPYKAVVWDQNYYWTATNLSAQGATPNTVIFRSTLGGNPNTLSQAQTPSQPIPGGDVVNGVFADTTTHYFFAATKNNGIYYTKDGGNTWLHARPDTQGSSPISYLCVAGPLDYGNGPLADSFAVGADGAPNSSGGYGYYVLSVSGQSLTRFSDSTKLLYSASVSKITVDTGTGNVLMGTNNMGLWRDTASDILSNTSNWVNE